MPRARDDGGVALVATLLIMSLLTVLATALALLSAFETRISATHRAASEALYAADAAAELVLDEASVLPDWGAIFTGEAPSRFVDGAPTGVRATPAGPIDLAAAAAAVDPGWRLRAHGALRDLTGLEGAESGAYVIVWVARRVDPGADILAVLAHGYAQDGVQRAVEVRIERSAAGLRRLSWHEVK